jgi:hypothetical protein
MTDTMPEQTTDQAVDWSDVEQSADTSYPEFPANPHNHRFTVSIDARGPMVVVRANTADEIKAACEDIESHEVGAALGRAYAAFKAGAALGNGLGATPVTGPPAPPAMPAGPQGNFNAPPPVPGVPGQAPAPWQNVGAPAAPPAPPAAPQAQNAEYRNAGWYRLDVPFPKKAEFDRICAEYQMRKGRPSEGGSFSFNSKGEKAWYVAPNYAGCFPQFSPVPA